MMDRDEDTFCGLCSREDTQGDAESATTNRIVDNYCPNCGAKMRGDTE